MGNWFKNLETPMRPSRNVQDVVNAVSRVYDDGDPDFVPSVFTDKEAEDLYNRQFGAMFSLAA